MSIETLVNIANTLHISTDYLLDNSYKIDDQCLISESFSQYNSDVIDDELKELFFLY